MNDFLIIYTLGCVLALLLTLVRLILRWFLLWISKENILQKNLRKIGPPEERSLMTRVLIQGAALLLDILLSWIIVVVASWQILAMISKFLRERLTSVPEEVRELRFPLWNNPMLPRESVWALLTALSAKSGDLVLNEGELRSSLSQLAEHYPEFDCVDALERLSALSAVDAVVLERVSASFAD